MSSQFTHITTGRSFQCYFVVIMIAVCCMMGCKAAAQTVTGADAYYEAKQYHVAAELYERILAADSANYRAAWRLAHAQRELFQYQEAEKLFGYVARHAEQNFPASLYYYAESLKRKHDYQSAIEWYDKYLALPEQKMDSELVSLARYEREDCLEAMLLPTGQTNYVSLERLPEPVSTEYQEFAPVIYRHDSLLIFSSTRMQATGPVSNRSGQRFSDQYLAIKDSASWQQHTDHERLTRLNSEGSEASGSFSGDGSYYYFTRCSDKGGNCHIYVSRKAGGRWQSVRMLPEEINQPGTNSKHPFISISGDSLFFVSDRSGGLGQSDIWLSVRDDQKNWQKAVNLGKAVNTPMDEIFPYYAQTESLLIFGSEGRDGPGGMDLYMIKLDDNIQSSAIPLEAPFNSTYDDCCLAVGRSRGYIASNREGDFDIFSFQKDSLQRLSRLLIGIPPVKGDQAISAGRPYDDVITDYSLLMNHKTEYLSVMHSDRQNYLSNGSSRFVLSADVNDIMLEQLRDEQALARGENNSATTTLTDTVSSRRILASFSTREISREEQVEISGRIRYADNFQEVPALRLYLLNQEGEVIKITTTNQQGSFRFINLQAASSYQIVNADDAGDSQFLLTYEVSSYGNEVQTLKFENIYFDFNRAALRNEARVALEELVAYYRQNPESVIEINAFTDTTGNDIYNLQLSRERGLATFDYLLNAGVDRSSLVINARGASTTASSSNSFVSQQLNRRVELYITGRELDYQSEVVTRMLRPKITLNTLSSRTGMRVEDIMRLNGIRGDQLQAYKPVRLYEWAVEKAPSLFYQMTVRSEE